MELIKPATFDDFRRLIEPLVLADEAEHGLIYGIAGTSSPPADAYCALALDGDAVVAAAIRTIERTALSLEKAPGAIALIPADAIRDPGLRGLLGPPQSLRAFAEASGREWRAGRGMTIYECRSVSAGDRVAGLRRVAGVAERDLLVSWAKAFTSEALGVISARGEAEAAADRYIANGTMHLWTVEGQPVACAAALGPTPRGIRIGGVYTAPESRGRGYASALVADLTQLQLDRGRAFVYLYADRANPTSNSIYQRLGYRRVADADDLWLV